MTTPLTLVIGTPRYSTWSLRPWLVLSAAHAQFDLVTIPLRQPETKAQILEYSPSGKVPLLIDGDVKIWDSLAIAEYLAETFPQAGLWPAAKADRAWARAISAEMHSGFQTLRNTCPMDVLADSPLTDLSDELRTDIHRIEAIWTQCRQAHQADGPFLFGSFTIADAMFAPVVTRFKTYHLPCNAVAHKYQQAVLDFDALRAWVKMAGE